MKEKQRLARKQKKGLGVNALREMGSGQQKNSQVLDKVTYNDAGKQLNVRNVRTEALPKINNDAVKFKFKENSSSGVGHSDVLMKNGLENMKT